MTYSYKKIFKYLISLISMLFILNLFQYSVSAAMTINGQSTLSNGLKIDAKGSISSISDLTDPNKVRLNVEAPANMTDSEFYDLMLKGPICWSNQSKLQVLNGKTTEPIPKKNGWAPKGTTFDLNGGLPQFKLTNVSKTYSGKSVDVIVTVTGTKKYDTTAKKAALEAKNIVGNKEYSNETPQSNSENNDKGPHVSTVTEVPSQTDIKQFSEDNQTSGHVKSGRSEKSDDKAIDKSTSTTTASSQAETAKIEDALQPQVSFSAGSDQAINSYIKNIEQVSISYQFVDSATGKPLNIMVFPAINDVDASQIFSLNGQVLGYDTDTLHSVGAGAFQGSDIGVNGADEFPKGGILYQFYGDNVQTSFSDPRGIDKADWSMSGIFGVYGSLRNGKVSRPSQGNVTRTIKFMKNGQAVKAPVEQKVGFKGNDVFQITDDNVKKISDVKPDGTNTWSAVQAPIVAGAIPDKKMIVQKQVDSGAPNETRIISYYPLAKLQVSDNNEYNQTQNTLKQANETFTYSAEQQVSSLAEGADPLNHYQMTLRPDKPVDTKQVRVTNEQGQDVTGLFEITQNKQSEVTVSAINLVDPAFYGHTYTLKVDVKPKQSLKNGEKIQATNQVKLNDQTYTTNSVTTKLIERKAVTPPAKPDGKQKVQHKATKKINKKSTSAQWHQVKKKPAKVSPKAKAKPTVTQVIRKKTTPKKTLPQAVGRKKTQNNSFKQVIKHQNVKKTAVSRAPSRNYSGTRQKQDLSKSKPKPKTKSKPKNRTDIFQKNTGFNRSQQKIIFDNLNRIERYGKKHGWSAAKIQKMQFNLLTEFSYGASGGGRPDWKQSIMSGNGIKDFTDPKHITRDLQRILGPKNFDSVKKALKPKKSNPNRPDFGHMLITFRGYNHGNSIARTLGSLNVIDLMSPQRWPKAFINSFVKNKEQMLLINSLAGDLHQIFGPGDFEADVDAIRAAHGGFGNRSLTDVLMSLYGQKVITNADRHRYINQHVSKTDLIRASFTAGVMMIMGGQIKNSKSVKTYLKNLKKQFDKYYPKFPNPKKIVNKTVRGISKKVNNSRLRAKKARRQAAKRLKQSLKKARGRVHRVYRKARRGVRRVYRRARRGVRRVYRKARRGVRRVYRRARRGVRRVYRKARRGVRRVYRRARRGVRRVYRRARRRIRRVYSRARRRVRRVYRKARRRVHRVYRRVRIRFRRGRRRRRRH